MSETVFHPKFITRDGRPIYMGDCLQQTVDEFVQSVRRVHEETGVGSNWLPFACSRFVLTPFRFYEIPLAVAVIQEALRPAYGDYGRGHGTHVFIFKGTNDSLARLMLKQVSGSVQDTTQFFEEWAERIMTDPSGTLHEVY